MVHPATYVFVSLFFIYLLLIIVGVCGQKGKCITAAIWLIPAITYFLVVAGTKQWLASIGYWLGGWIIVAAIAIIVLKIEKKYKKSRVKTA